MNPRLRIILFLCFLLGGISAGSPVADAATLFVSPQQVTIEPGETIPLTVLLDSEGEVINVAEVTLQYPAEMLEVVSISRGGSLFTLWADEPTVRTKGIIYAAGGVPGGSVVIGGEVFSILVRMKARGQAVVWIDPAGSSVLASDGEGTKLPLTTRSATLAGEFADPLLPRIASPSHPDDSAWSKERTVVATWVKQPQAFTSFLLSRDPLTEPDEFAEETEGFVSYPALADGIWYFALRQRLSGESWGTTTVRHRFMIDGTPPQAFSITLVPEGKQTIVSFSATDTASGVDQYAMRVLRPRFSPVPFFFHGTWERVKDQPVVLKEGEIFSSIEVRAVDLAGNVQMASVDNPELQVAQKRFLLAVIIVLFVLLVLVVMLRLKRRRVTP